VLIHGLKKSQDKIDAILKVKKPENVTQLRSFLGLVQYYGKFLQNLATEAAVDDRLPA
jgi:hypothetical protein